MPPLSEMEVMGRVVQLSLVSTTAWLVEPEEESKRSPIIVVRAMVIPDEGRFPVRLLNPRNEPVNLRKGDQIAVMEPLPVDIANVVAVVDDATVPRADREQVLWQMVSKSEDKLSNREKEQLFSVLVEFADIFAVERDELGRTGKIKHEINTGTATPTRQHVRRIPPARRTETSKLIKDMLKKEVIRPSASPWASPIVLVRKKDGSTRFCVDYRKVNHITREDAYPLPRVDDTLDPLAGSKWFSTLDLISGY